MIVYITEEQEFNFYKSLLKEYGGYVNVWEQVIPYITKSIGNVLQNKILPSFQKSQSSDVLGTMLNYYGSLDKDELDDIISPIELDWKTLQSLGIDFLKKLTVHLFFSESSGPACFNSQDIEIDENNICDNAEVYINVYSVLNNESNISVLLQHELTHAYQLIKQYQQNGKEHTDLGYQNKYYSIEHDNLINLLSYLLSKVEINAYISELYTTLKDNNATLDNYKDIIKSEGIITKVYHYMSNFEKRLLGEKGMEYTKQVIEWLEENPEHVDMFPSVGNKNPQQYRNRLISMIRDRKKYVEKKMNNIIGRYFMDQQQAETQE